MAMSHDAGSPGELVLRPIRVLVVDDSALVRRVVTKMLSELEGIEVVGDAPDAFVARERIEALEPDVITLDIEMPGLDGLTFLRGLMATRPMPVVILSSLGQRGGAAAIDALAAGACEVVCKPAPGTRREDLQADLGAAVRGAAERRRHAPIGPTARGERRSSLPPRISIAPSGSYPAPGASSLPPRLSTMPPHAYPGPSHGAANAPPRLASPRANAAPMASRAGRTVVIGASTGGTVALESILTTLPANCPPIVIVQHMPPGFTGALARRLDAACALHVREAVDGDRVEPGIALIAPGAMHLELVRDALGVRVRTFDADRVNGHRPSVDVLFHSAARVLKEAGVGVILTGMGNDGARGLLEMSQAGAHTIGQTEASCVVYGMPRAAAMLGAVDEVLDLPSIAARLRLLGSKPAAAVAARA
jgi:two-component system chemotaxis response regulator CheB